MIKDTDIHLDSVCAMAAEVNVLSDFFPSESYMIDVPEWASGFKRDTSVFSILRVNGSNPQFRKPEKFRKEILHVFRPKRSNEFSRCWVMVS